MTLQTIQIADPELISAFLAAADTGKPCDHATLAKELGRPRSDTVKRALDRAAKANLITLDPAGAPETTRNMIAALTGRPAAPGSAGTILVSIEDLTPSPHNPRKTFDHDELEQLAESILAKGLLQSPLARPHPEEAGRYQIAAGERRRRAMALLAEQGRSSAEFDPKAIEIKVRELDDADMIMIGILENADRVDPSPIEEAEAFVQLRDLIASRDPDNAGQATQIIADRLGKTRRHVQLRIALAEKLCEQARDQLAKEKITLAQARALAEIPKGLQAEILHNISRGHHGYRTADDIRTAVSRLGFPASKAKFKHEAYIAAVEAADMDPADAYAENEDGGKFYLIEPICKRLQGEAVDQIKAKLEAKGAGFVHVTDWFRSYDYEDAAKDDPAEIVGAVIEFSPHTLEVKTHKKIKLNEREARQAKKAEKEAEAAKKAKADREKAAEKAGVRLAPQPHSRKHWIAAKMAKTATIQKAIAENDNGKIGAALAVIGALESGAIGENSVDAHSVRIYTRHHNGEDRNFPKLGLAAKALAPLAEEYPEAFHLTEREALVTDARQAFEALIKCDCLGAILGAVMADRFGSWCGAGLSPGINEGPGDTPLVCAVAEHLELEHAEQTCDAEYFGQFSAGSIGMMAKRIGADPSDLPKARGAAAEKLAEVPAAKSWIPPEMRFGPPELIAAEVDSLLKGGAA